MRANFNVWQDKIMANTEFLKDQVLVTKGKDPRTRQDTLVQVIFVEYLTVPKIYGDSVLDCLVRGEKGGENYVDSANLANILHAEAVLARHQRRAHGF